MNPRKECSEHKARSGVVALILLIVPSAFAANNSISPPPSGPAVAFARYISSIQQRSPFTESGPVLVEISGSLPALYKQARVLAVRRTTESEKAEYAVLEMEGDAIVMQEVVARYLEIAKPIE